MRMSRLFSRTLRETPAEAEAASYQLLLRAGFIRQLSTGIFSYLPLGRLALNRIERIIREEMNAIGGQEISMPIIHPAELWKESGRWYQIDAEMGRFQDRTERDMVLAMTHEEVIADLVRKEIRSYRQLPVLLYQIQTKWRDDPRPRAGLIRAREFTMKDSYSLDADWEGLDRQYQANYQAYVNIFRRCELPVIAVQSDTGMMGGQLAHEFMYLTPAGEDTLLLCDACGYSANRQIAKMRKPVPANEARKMMEKVATPECKSIQALAQFLGIPESKTAKAVFYIADMASETEKLSEASTQAPNHPGTETNQFIFAIVRGDMEVNETKLANILHARALRPATEEEIRATGAEPGYASPVGLDKRKSQIPLVIMVDDLVPQSPNLVAGANERWYHLLNVNYGRDYQADVVADITAAQEGDACPECGAPMQARRGVEVGNIFKLGTRYSEAMGCTFLDAEGQSRPVVMGSYGIGIGRLLACIAEEHHDENGLSWPFSIAPYPVHLIALAGKGSDETSRQAGQLYNSLLSQGIEALFDDREESPGVKFKDADLIGLPLRLTMSERALKQGGVELKLRNRMEKEIIPVGEVIERVLAEIRDHEQDALGES